jgi:hypothetical protein
VVNGHPWPVRDDQTLWIPAGTNVIEPAQKEAALRVLDFNGNLRSASYVASGIRLSYQSNGHALAILNAQPRKLDIDGAAVNAKALPSGSNFLLMLPRGQHVIQIDSQIDTQIDTDPPR